jgi:hypothetical protein
MNALSRFLLILFVGLLAAPQAHAATLSFTNDSAAVGRTLTVSVLVSAAGGESINGISSRITYPTDKLSLQSLSKAGSIITFWAEEPSFSNGAGTASIEGIVPNPGYSGQGGRVITLVFQVRAAGSATLSFEDASVLANDGKGTDVLTGAYSRTLTLTDAPAPAPTPTPTPEPTPKPKPVETSDESDEVEEVIEEPATTTPTSTVAETIESNPFSVPAPKTLWDIPVFILALLGLCALGIAAYYGIPVIARALNERRKRPDIVERSFALLKKDIEDHIARLKRTSDGSRLTAKEITFLKSFEKNLAEVESMVEAKLKK